jgi:SAM-dependent methyltransferase
VTREDWRALNLANWEERTPVHLRSPLYDFSSHRAGRGRLDPIVEAEIGGVAGLRIVHLQCHLGDDSIALAQRGAASVLGVDFSPSAIAGAQALAAEVGARGTRFVLSDVLDVPATLPAEAGRHDLVFTSWGTIGWLPDIGAWARAVAHCLRPGGALYFADMHPVAAVFDDAGLQAGTGQPGWLVPYFERAGQIFDDPSDYADPAARLANSRMVNFLHPLADILGALRAAGMALDWLHEHPRLAWPAFRGQVQDTDRLWTWPDRPWLPLAVSLRAVKQG